MTMDAGLDWFNREIHPQNGPIPVLIERQKTIAGVRVDNLHDVIPDHQRGEIEKALRKLTLNMKYTKPPDEARENGEAARSNCEVRDEFFSYTFLAFRQKLLEEGKSEADIDRKIKSRNKFNTRVYRNVRIDSIVWNGEDPSAMFEYKPRGAPPGENARMVTVAEYFEIHHKIKLRFPKMPLFIIKGGKKTRPRRTKELLPVVQGEEVKVETKKDEPIIEKLPLEFFFQAWSKVREVDHNPDVLEFNDHFASTRRMEHLQHVKRIVEEVKMQSGPELGMLLQQLNLTTDLEPAKLEASVLPQPVMRFLNNEKVPNDGSWNLAEVKFSKPAFMSSFAIVDFANVVGENRCSAFIRLFEIMASHGIEMPRNVDVEQAILEVIVAEHLPSGREKETVSTSSFVSVVRICTQSTWASTDKSGFQRCNRKVEEPFFTRPIEQRSWLFDQHRLCS